MSMKYDLGKANAMSDTWKMKHRCDVSGTDYEDYEKWFSDVQEQYVDDLRFRSSKVFIEATKI